MLIVNKLSTRTGEGWKVCLRFAYWNSKRTDHALIMPYRDRLATYFEGVLETLDTQKLQVYCWYSLARHLDLRGTAVFVKMNKDDTVFKTDKDGLEYSTIWVISNHEHSGRPAWT